MENIFAALMEAQRVSQDLSHMAGRSYGVTVGVVTDREDPEGYGRVKAALPAKGGKSSTDWLWRVPVMPGLSPVVPRVGDSVWVLFKDGDPHVGMYIGVTNNKPNPSWEDKDGLRMVIGSVTLTIGSDGVVTLLGAKEINLAGQKVSLIGEQVNLVGDQVNITAANTAIKDATSVSINGKQALTLGSVDTGGFINVSKGW